MIFFFSMLLFAFNYLYLKKKDPLQIPFNYFENVINNAQI